MPRNRDNKIDNPFLLLRVINLCNSTIDVNDITAVLFYVFLFAARRDDMNFFFFYIIRVLFYCTQGRCQRTDPPCKYLHPPQHLKEQLLQNGRNNLIMKNLQQIQRVQQTAVLPSAGAPFFPVVSIKLIIIVFVAAWLHMN